ncbi:phage tail protein [Aurantimonas sp. C2-6-R+9]|uniref:phage tail-collar fiber domain-containing protein n=1 Tax=unclassified Aurantimonas TaxID=2638230 RepID=UPI002E1895FF|nr:MULTISPECIES: phage tail protein [unclassified Aurantimonas]MEC5291958.1 phage tail protein [Aurantimonas sp. C2-3-R2]MEC5382070.1 phage tail protein [Aurantimonas sp. C2-6-R+9]MEC5413044.1 phage tail protein [Aurantimonas sp. C2-4-R8]
MTQSNFTIITRYGREWQAKKAAGQVVPAIDRMVFGDGDRIPAGGEAALLNEVHREGLSNWGILADETAAFFDAYLSAEIGGFVIREHGLLDAAGGLIAIGRRDPGIPKADPATGAADDFTYRIDVFFTDLQALVVAIDPVHGLTAERRIDTATGLAGGGDLSQDRTLTTDWSNLGAAAGVFGDSDTLNLRKAGSQWSFSLGQLGAWQRGFFTDPAKPETERFVRVSDYSPFEARNANADIPVNGWQSAPPGAPAEGDRYIVKPAGTGAWAGQDGRIAIYIGGAWTFAAPLAGLQVQYWSGRQIVLRYDGVAWAEDLATETAAGRIELETTAETEAGANTGRASQAGGVLAAIAKRIKGAKATAPVPAAGWNDAVDWGMYPVLLRGSDPSGPIPGSAALFHALNFAYAGDQLTQIAIPYAADTAVGSFLRGRYQGAWSKWAPLAQTAYIDRDTVTYLNVYPTVLTADHKVPVTAVAGTVSMPAFKFSWRNFKTISVPAQNFAVVTEKVYHLKVVYDRVADTTTATLHDTASAAYNPGALAASDPSFDAGYDEIFVASIDTRGVSVPLVYALENAETLELMAEVSTSTGITFTTNDYLYVYVHQVAYNWARRPSLRQFSGVIGATAPPASGIQGVANLAKITSSTRHGISTSTKTDFSAEATGTYVYLQYNLRA